MYIPYETAVLENNILYLNITHQTLNLNKLFMFSYINNNLIQNLEVESTEPEPEQEPEPEIEYLNLETVLYAKFNINLKCNNKPFIDGPKFKTDYSNPKLFINNELGVGNNASYFIFDFNYGGGNHTYAFKYKWFSNDNISVYTVLKYFSLNLRFNKI